MLCSYGCGREANYFFKNGKGCCEKTTNKCPRMREINSLKNSGENNGMYGRKHSQETKNKIGEKSKQKVYTKEMRQKMSELTSGINNPMYGKKNPHTEESKKKISKALKGKPLSQKNKDGISKALKGRKFTKEWRKKLSDSAKRKFKNKDFLKQFKESQQQKPNKLEMLINNIIYEYGYEYVGDFSLWIDGKNPDFINKNDKKIIEVFGDYYHTPEDEIIRYKHFKKNGYKILFIWEHDVYKDIEQVKKRFLKFHYKENI